MQYGLCHNIISTGSNLFVQWATILVVVLYSVQNSVCCYAIIVQYPPVCICPPARSRNCRAYTVVLPSAAHVSNGFWPVILNSCNPPPQQDFKFKTYLDCYFYCTFDLWWLLYHLRQLIGWWHWRRINAEEKAKVVAAGKEFNTFCLPNCSDDISLFFYIYPSSMDGGKTKQTIFIFKNKYDEMKKKVIMIASTLN